ncbi:hypothetical protein QJQ45_020387, partial [Haematococcus lacustris]
AALLPAPLSVSWGSEPAQVEGLSEEEKAESHLGDAGGLSWLGWLFYSYFKTLVGKEVTVELKNDLAITGTLHSVDQYLNIKLVDTRAVNEVKYPHMMDPSTSIVLRVAEVCEELLHPRVCSSVHTGAIARHIPQLLQCLHDEYGMRLHAQLPASAVDVEILHDATRREARGG